MIANLGLLEQVLVILWVVRESECDLGRVTEDAVYIGLKRRDLGVMPLQNVEA